MEIAHDGRVLPDELRTAQQSARVDAVMLGKLADDFFERLVAVAAGRALLRAPIVMVDLAGSVVRRMEPLARDAGVDLTADAGNAIANVDRVRAEQAVGNLVANAIAHAPRGSAVEMVARLEPADQGAVLMIEVLDRGPGVPSEEQDRIFEPFQRGVGAPGAGAGLGLATARAAAEAHGGQIGVDDRPGGGARFWMRLPA